MRIRCFGCGKFLRVGTGTVAQVKRFDGKPDQYFCQKCVGERVAFLTREKGRPAPFKEYCEKMGTVEVV